MAFFQLQLLFTGNLKVHRCPFETRQHKYSSHEKSCFFQMKWNNSRMSRATWTDNFLKQQPRLTVMKSSAHFQILNLGVRWKLCSSTAMGARKTHKWIQKIGLKKKIIKRTFSTTQQATNFNNEQIELAPVIIATKLFLRNP